MFFYAHQPPIGRAGTHATPTRAENGRGASAKHGGADLSEWPSARNGRGADTGRTTFTPTVRSWAAQQRTACAAKFTAKRSTTTADATGTTTTEAGTAGTTCS